MVAHELSEYKECFEDLSSLLGSNQIELTHPSPSDQLELVHRETTFSLT